MILDRIRQARAKITYNGQDITTSLETRTGSFTYTDPDSGESDSCSLTVYDPDDKWLGGMFPNKGDKLSAQIAVQDWKFQGDNRALDCGIFVIDDPSFSFPPMQVAFKGVSQPADTDFTERERTQTWENVTVQNMASEIAGRYGLALQYTADEVKIDSLEQSGATDSAFLKSTCDKYGLGLKIYSQRIVIFDKQTYKDKPAVLTIDKGEMTGGSFTDTLAGTYTGGKMKYKAAKDGKDLEAQVGTDKRLLSVNGKADSQADAEKQIKAAVNKANEDATKMTVRIPGNPNICSTQCVNITGLGKANGKYYVRKVTHTIGSKYETSLDLFKVQPSL